MDRDHNYDASKNSIAERQGRASPHEKKWLARSPSLVTLGAWVCVAALHFGAQEHRSRSRIIVNRTTIVYII